MLACRGSPSPACPLVGSGLTDGGDHQTLHTRAGAVAVLLAETGVNDILQKGKGMFEATPSLSRGNDCSVRGKKGSVTHCSGNRTQGDVSRRRQQKCLVLQRLPRLDPGARLSIQSSTEGQLGCSACDWPESCVTCCNKYRALRAGSLTPAAAFSTTHTAAWAAGFRRASDSEPVRCAQQLSASRDTCPMCYP